jgi:hypothetical protein
MSEEAKTKEGPEAASVEVEATETSDTGTPMTRSAKICATVSSLVLVAGFLHGFGIDSAYLNSLSGQPVAAAAFTVGFALLFALFFEKTRKIAFIALMGSAALAIFGAIVSFSGYGWYAFFTTGLEPEGKFPLALSQSGGALFVGGTVMLITCLFFHLDSDFDPGSLVLKTLSSIFVSAFVTSLLLLFVTIYSLPQSAGPRPLTEAEKVQLQSFGSCEVRDGRLAVRCELPELNPASPQAAN